MKKFYITVMFIFMTNVLLLGQTIRVTKVIDQYASIDKGQNAGIIKGQIYDVKRNINNQWIFITQVTVIEAMSDKAAIKSNNKQDIMQVGDVLFSYEEKSLNELLITNPKPNVRPLVAQQEEQDYRTTCSEAEYDAEKDIDPELSWYFGGFLLGIFAYVYAWISPAKPPAERLVGKDSNYVRIYSACYKKRAKKMRKNAACTGWACSWTVSSLIISLSL